MIASDETICQEQPSLGFCCGSVLGGLTGGKRRVLERAFQY